MPPDPGAGSGPRVRVGVRRGLARVEATCAAGFVAQNPSGEALVDGAHHLRIELESPSTPTDPSPGRKVPSLTVAAINLETLDERRLSLPPGPLLLRSRRPEILMEVDGRSFRGELLIQPGPGRGFSLVNTLALEDYLRGVVPVELSPSAPIEALKAQAIAARSYALASLGRHAPEGFDLCAGTHCQAYGGVAREHEATDRAVRETRGRVLLAGGKPLAALFHAVCGGATDGPADVWDGASEPDVRKGTVDAPAPPGLDLTTETGILELTAQREALFCGASADFRWERECARPELERTFARTLPLVLGSRAPLGELRSLSVVNRTLAGRATAILVEGSQGAYLVRGEGIRWLFGSGRPDDRGLKSRRFVIQPVADPDHPDGPPSRYRLIGFGWGHGVGLCQAGAVGMAKRGAAAEEILRHYFPGVEVGYHPD
ncbi:MAG: SpoIID/LytB domain-containing protein [Armatimonadetes bacterium]|nr:SpoIID/LytB domain-containing protein [Armatimonadota bacterium]